ncbi:MaoC family dehydratase [bacterium]|nr:MaoC family dehydratase [bacterium]
MTHIRRKAIEGLNVGDVFSITREFTEEDTTSFADLTRDYNPVHFDNRFAEVKGLSNRICHGLLVAGMITEIGGQMGCLASEMSFDFKKPVYFGDCIECSLTITELNDKGWISSRAEYVNQNGIIVIEGLLKGIVPGFKEKEVMKIMVAEGDPTNRIN